MIILQITFYVVCLCLVFCCVSWTVKFVLIQLAEVETMKRDRELSLQVEQNLIAENKRRRIES